MRLATTLENFTDYDPSPARAARLCAACGFRFLDLSFYMPMLRASLADGSWAGLIQEAAQTAEQLGLSFIQAHSPPGNALADDGSYEQYLVETRRSIEACGMLGIPNLVVHAGCKKGVWKEEFYERNRRFYRALVPAMEYHGVRVLIENTPAQDTRDFYYFVTGADMREFIGYMGHPMVHAVWDTGHGHMTTRATGQTQRENLVALGDELRGLHVHGNNGLGDDHLAPFVGGLDLDDLMPALLDIGYAGYFTFEASYTIRLRGAFPKRQGLSDGLLTRAEGIGVKSVALLYDIGKCILEEYDCFER